MTKHFHLIVLSTFVIGFMTGVFIFFQTRTVNEPVNTPVFEKTEGFEVLGYKYGGCETFGCTSYRILEDGSYTYIERNKDGGDERYEDSISPKQLEELTALLTDVDLRQIMEHPYTGGCPTDYDGIAFRYEIQRNGERFSIDSCKEDLNGVPLFKTLADYFEIFSVIHRNE